VSRVRRRERAARNREWVSQQVQYHQTLPDYEGGLVIVIMWVNAVVATTLNAVLAVVVVRAARRSWRNRRLGVIRALCAGPRWTLLGVLAGMVVHRQVLRRWVMPVLERRGLIRPGWSSR
jgi:hypothetical protein